MDSDSDDGSVLGGSYRKRKDEIFKRKWSAFDDEFQRGRHPDFFGAVEIARDGGFSEIKKLWSPLRWVYAISAVAFVFSNVLTLSVNDLAYVLPRVQDTSQNATEQEVSIAVIKDDFMVTGYLVDIGAQGFNHVMGTDFEFQHLRLQVIAGIELLLLSMISLRLIHLMLSALCTTDEYTKWSSAAKCFFYVVPELSTFSGMRLLHFVSPRILSADFSKFVAYSTTRWKDQSDSRWWYIFLLTRKWSKLILTRLIFLLVGMDSFLFKVRLSYKQIHRKDITFWTFLSVFMFVRQVMGIVQVGLHVRDRIFLFIFGGEDAVMELEERAVKEVWEGMFVRAAWKKFRQVRAMALLLSFDDTDFQLMVLEVAGGSSSDGEKQLGVCDFSETDDDRNE